MYLDKIKKNLNNKSLLKKITLFILFAFVFSLNTPTYSQSSFSKTLSYQGKLTDSSGTTVADGSYTIRARIYDAPTGGTLLFDETQNISTIAGLFSTLIGQSSSTASLNFNQILYLGISVEGDPEMTPRKVLTSAPSAFESDKLDGLSSEDFLKNTGTSTISTSTTDTILTLNQEGGTGDIFNAKYNNTDVFTITSTGNVGIGTSSPYAPLSVNGQIVGSYFTATDTTSTSTFTNISISQNSNLGTVIGGTWQGSVISPTYGGTGISSYSTGDIIYASATNTLGTLSPGINGQVLKLSGGVPTWANESGGSTLWSNTLNSLALYPTTPTQTVIIGGTATTALGYILEVQGNALIPYASTTAITATDYAYLGTTTARHLTVSNITERNILTASDAGAGDRFGRRASLNYDGSVMVVGSNWWDGPAGSDQGAVYTYDWGGSSWVQRGSVLTASDAGFSDYFGESVSLSSDGLILAVGASGWDGTYQSGGVYIYDWNPGTSSWVQRGSVLTASDAEDGDNYGTAVALSDDGLVLAVGAYGWDGTHTDQGAVYIYDWNGASWVERSGIVIAPDPGNDDRFGTAVSISGNKNILAVGAYRWDGVYTDQGAVYIYDWNGTNWIQRGSVLTASDPGLNDFFGVDVSLSRLGTQIFIGSSFWDGVYTDQGAVYIYDWNGSSWVQRGSVLTASDAGASDGFGTSVDVSSNGKVLAIGPFGWDGPAGSDQGAVYTYDITGSGIFAGPIQTSSITTTDSTATSTFANGINLDDGCFAVDGVCVGSGSGSGVVQSGLSGQTALYLNDGTTLTPTSTITISTTTGNVGIGTSTPNYGFTVATRDSAFNAGYEGEIGTWRRAGQLTSNLANHGSVVVGGYVYHIGGNISSPTSPIATVKYAKINSDGTIGLWNTTSSLPGARLCGAAISIRDYIYYLGGSSSDCGTPNGVQEEEVFYAKVNSDGTLSPWKTNPHNLIQGRYNFSVTTNGGYIYIFGGSTNSSTANNNAWYAKINSDGSLGEFKSNNSLLYSAYHPSSYSHKNRIYVLGGRGGPPSYSFINYIQYADINNNGQIGTWQTYSLGFDMRLNASIISNGYLYLLGGSNNSSLDTVRYAKINNDGSLNNWVVASSKLPVGYWSTQVVLHNGYFYFVGGSDSSGYISSILYSSLPRTTMATNLDLIGFASTTLSDPASGGTAGASIFAGDIYSNGTLEVTGNTNLWNGLNVNGLFSLKATTSSNQDFSIFSIQNATGTNPILTALYNGNVGIGTSSPYAPLSVQGQVSASHFTATSNTSTSTFANGISVTGGCISFMGTCLNGTSGVGDSWSTTSMNYYMHSSTTVPTIYKSNTWTALNNFTAGATSSLLTVTGNSWLATTSMTNLTVSKITERNILTASDAGAGDAYGISTSLSGDGNVMVVGAYMWDGAGGTGQGAVYTYDKVGSSWVQRGSPLTAFDAGADDQYGVSVSLSFDGGILIVGSRYWDGSFGNQGAVYIYDWNSLSSSWVQRGGVLTASDPGGDNFGTSVSISSNGNILAVGAVTWDNTHTDQGAVYIYDWNTGTSSWVQRGGVLTASVPNNYDYFGRSVSLSSNGNILAVGAHFWDNTQSDQGGVYIYDWNSLSSSWVQRGSVLTASDAGIGDAYGVSTSLSSNGNILMVGAYTWDGAYTDQGAVYIYDWNPGTLSWVQRGYVLTASDAGGFDYFGTSVSLSSNGNILAVGAYSWDGTYTDQGAVYTYDLTGDAVFAGNINVNGAGTSTISSNLWVGDTLKIGNSSLYLNSNSITDSTGLFSLNTNATSTLSNGLELSQGCFSVNGVCLTPGGSSGVNPGLAGQLPYYESNGSTLSATSSIALSPTGNFGIGTTSPMERLTLEGGNFLQTATGTPKLLGNYTWLNGTASTNDVYVSGKYAYLADNSEGLRIIDISNPKLPILEGFYNTVGAARGVHVSGKYAYIADGPSGMQIVDISNSNSPFLAGTIVTGGNSEKVYVSGKYAYLADGGSGLRVIDVSTPTSPKLISTYNTTGSAYGIYVSGKYAYVADYSGLRIIDISNSSSPWLTSSYDTTGDYAYDVYVSGKYAYVVDYYTGLQILDVSNPASPSFVGSYDTPGNARGVYVSGNYCYVADSSFGIQVLDISDKTNPTLISNYNTDGNAIRIKISGKYAYVADGATGGISRFKILDITGIDTPAISTGNIATNQINISENADIGNNLYIRNGLNVGTGGIYANGPLSISLSSTTDTNQMSGYFEGNVGIGTTTVNSKLTVAYSGSIYGYVNSSNGAWVSVSDRRFKQNITTIEDSGIDKINKLRPVYYDTLNITSTDGKRGDNIGFIAQEVEEIIPEVISTDNLGYKAISYATFAPIFAKALQELSASTTELYTKLDTIITNGTISNPSNNIWITDPTTGHIKTVTSSILDIQDKDILNVRSIISSSGKWSIDEEGRIEIKKVIADKLCIDSTCIDEEDLRALLINSGIDVSSFYSNSSPQTPEGSTTLDENTDSEPPLITLLGNNPANIELNSTYVDMGAEITDNKDMNLGYTTEVYELNNGLETKLFDDINNNSLNTSTNTTYLIKYNTEDSAGNKALEVTRTVIVGSVREDFEDSSQ